IAIAAGYLLHHRLAKRILVVDLDVHQGNGTARIFQENDSVFTLSVHGDKNYPLHKEVSDLDISLPDGTGDEQYLSILSQNLEDVLNSFKPDFVFYQCGVDVLETDKLGRLSLTLNGCEQRDAIVLNSCHERGLPLVASMGGGYSPNIALIVEAHANTFRLANNIYF
ncbi:MAG: histone deacetylase, partial [Bacteroidota bacterium]